MLTNVTGDRTQVKELVQKEGNVDVQDRGGNTPLMYAALHGCYKVKYTIKALLI